MTFGERLSKERKAKGYTQEQLSRAVGIAKSTLANYETDKREPNVPTIISLAEALGVTGDVLLGLDHPADTRLSNKKMFQLKQIPLVGPVAAGQPITAVVDAEEWLTVDEHDRVDFALRVKGDSMTAVGIFDGDIIYVRQQPIVNNGEIAAVQIDDGHIDSAEVTCKRFFQIGKNVILQPESHNPANKTREIKLGGDLNVSVLGKVIFLKSNIEGR